MRRAADDSNTAVEAAKEMRGNEPSSTDNWGAFWIYTDESEMFCPTPDLSPRDPQIERTRRRNSRSEIHHNCIRIDT
jgi:hypothetical protein